jgi:hypothetical protein
MLNRTLPQRKTVIESKYAGIAGRRIPNMKTINVKTYGIGLLVLALAMASTAAFANDNVIATVTNDTGATAVIVSNGVAQGTIQPIYSLSASSCTTGTLATFNLAMKIELGKNNAPTYPVTLTLEDAGNGTGVQLAASPATLTVSGPNWTGSSVVTVTIVDCTKLSPGNDIVGNLKVSSSDSHLKTITSINVHVREPISASACLKVYSFETNQDTGDQLSSVGIVVPHLTVKSSNPGQISVDSLVVNTCPDTKSFDLAVGIDSNWSLNPSGNPGNATFTYNTSGDLDPSTFSLTSFGIGTAQGQTVCLRNVMLAQGDMFLVTEHSQINSGVNVSSLNNPFNFSTTLYIASTGCTGSGNNPDAPNPATSTLTWTVN